MIISIVSLFSTENRERPCRCANYFYKREMAGQTYRLKPLNYRLHNCREGLKNSSSNLEQIGLGSSPRLYFSIVLFSHRLEVSGVPTTAWNIVKSFRMASRRDFRVFPRPACSPLVFIYATVLTRNFLRRILSVGCALSSSVEISSLVRRFAKFCERKNVHTCAFSTVDVW